MATLTNDDLTWREGGTPQYSATITDENGDPQHPETLTVTITEARSGRVINNKLNFDILDQCTQGVLSWVPEPADNAIIGGNVPVGGTERHRIEFRWTWASGTRAWTHVIMVDVENCRSYPIESGSSSSSSPSP